MSGCIESGINILTLGLGQHQNWNSYV